MSTWQRITQRAFCGVCLAATPLLVAGQAAAQSDPSAQISRGPVAGIVKLVLLLLLLLVAAVAGNWLARDATGFENQKEKWYAVFVGGAALALLLVLVIPIIYLSFPLALAAIAGPVVWYGKWRDAKVPPQERVFTPQHVKYVLTHLFSHEQEGEIAAERAVHLSSLQHISEQYGLLYMNTNDFPIRISPESDQERACFEKAEAVMSAAIERQAGAFYLVPHGQEMLLRLRVGDAIRDGGKVGRKVGEGMIRFIKRLAGLDVDEQRKPQNGRFVVLRDDKGTNVSVETAGSIKGEQLVAKLYSRELLELRLVDSGMRPEQVELLSGALNHSGGGIVLMSSPPRSGRTISMYAALREYDLFSKSVMAVESLLSIEYPAVNQLEVDKAAGQSLAEAVQVALRSDPDVVMIETVSDAEAARMMMLGAAAGKIMIGGLAASDAGQAIKKFMAAVGDPKSVASVLLASTNQRLLRKLCSGCSEAYRPNPEFLRKANLQAAKVEVLNREPKTRPLDKDGKTIVCPICGNEGYTGRMAFYEIMVLDDEARGRLAAGGSVTEVRTQLRKQGQEFLQEEGLRKVVDGVTSVSELLRVLKPGK
ncbi:MAG: hypothetical protein GWP05_10220 [Anaerolineaceae bacterium]|nr:hypothetical protein [Anaerolineaceae bacterium]